MLVKENYTPSPRWPWVWGWVRAGGSPGPPPSLCLGHWHVLRTDFSPSHLSDTLSIRDNRFPGGSDGKASVYNGGDLGSSPGLGRSLEKEMAIHSSTIAWKIPWTEEPGRLQSMGSQRVGHDWAISLSLSNYQTQVLYTLRNIFSQNVVKWLN